MVSVIKGFNHLRYKFLYLSSRAIGQASMTKNFLKSIKQNGVGKFDYLLTRFILSASVLLNVICRLVILKSFYKYGSCLNINLQIFIRNS